MLTACRKDNNRGGVDQHYLATRNTEIKHSRAVDRTTTHDMPVSRILPPTMPKSNTHELWTERRPTTCRSAGSCHPRCPNQTLTSCGQNDDPRHAGQQDLATHDAQIKHSRAVDRTTTHDMPVSRILPPTTPKSNTHFLWTERPPTTCRSAGSCHQRRPNQTLTSCGQNDHPRH